MIVPPIKLLQLNMGRTSVVNDQLLSYVQTNGIDIALLQEPYTRRGKLVGLDARPLRCILSLGAYPAGSNQIQHGSCIVIFNPNLVVSARNDLSSNNIAVATLELEGGRIIHLISAYFKFCQPTADHLAELNRVLDSLQHPFVICADANAFSRIWFSRISDHRGRLALSQSTLSALHLRRS